MEIKFILLFIFKLLYFTRFRADFKFFFPQN
jgi:hypothetical protein